MEQIQNKHMTTSVGQTLAGAAFFILSLLTVTAGADNTPYMLGKRFAAGDYSGGKVCVVEPDGKISWEQAAPSCDDLWILPGGSILFNTGHGVKEVAKDGTVLFEYQSDSEVFAVQRLANGNTFVGECSAGRLLELTPDGKAVWTFKAPGGVTHSLARLANGNTLIACGDRGEPGLFEVNPAGEIVWTFEDHQAFRTISTVQVFAEGDTPLCGEGTH